MADQKSDVTDIAARLQTYFNPKLLEALDFNLVFASYGLNQGYNIHGTAIRFFRPRAASTAATGAITEITTPTSLATVPTGYKDITLSQRGELSEKISDVVQATDLLNIVQLYTKTFGEDGALDLDTVCRNALSVALNDVDNTYASNYFDRYAGVANTGDSSTDFASLHALSAANGKITRTEHLKCITQLKANRVPTIGGKYVAIMPPQVIHDIRLDTTWVSAATNVNTSALYKNGQIELDGAVIVPTDNPFREGATYKTYSATGANFSTVYLGRDAFGIPSLKDKRAGSAPLRPKILITGLTPDAANPLALWCQVGWKVFYGCAPFITNVTGEVPHYVILRSKSTFA